MNIISNIKKFLFSQEQRKQGFGRLLFHMVQCYMQDVYETDRFTTAATPDVITTKIMSKIQLKLNILDGAFFQDNGNEECERSCCLYRSPGKHALQ